MHLVIATRRDPPLPLARLRLAGDINEIRASDLRFSEEETGEFLNDGMQLHLSREGITILAERTEGWIAGLQMAALSLRGRVDPAQFIQSFSGFSRYILDYPIEEVLARQPGVVKVFLLVTARGWCGFGFSESCDVATRIHSPCAWKFTGGFKRFF